MGRTFHVTSRETRQTLAWLCAATAIGLSVPKFLVRAGDIYARHLAWMKIRREDRAMLASDKAFYEARRRR